MISSIGNSYAATTTLPSSRTATSSTSFGAAVTLASASTAASDIATISDAAKVAAASSEVVVSGGPYGSYTKEQLADAAHEISASQGLPDGQYDFSKLTGKQLNVVTNDMTINKGMSYDSTKGLQMLSLFASISAENGYPDKVQDVGAELKGSIAFSNASGDSTNAKMWNDTLSLISGMDRPSRNHAA